jgi:enoyl-CoA hydratase/carnithine racemase
MDAVTYESSERLIVESHDDVLLVRLNRPDAMNAFDDELHAEFPRLLQRIEADGHIRAVVLTGNGRAFSAGGSFDEFERFRLDFAARRKAMRQARRLVDEMVALHVPVIAAVNGPAVGLGATLMSLCDIVFIADNAFIADPTSASHWWPATARRSRGRPTPASSR